MPSVRAFMVPAEKCFTAFPDDTVRAVVTAMVQQRIGCIVITDGAVAKGIVTTHDIGKYYLEGVDLNVPISTVTTDSQISRTNSSCSQAVMHIHHAVVVDDKKNFAGVFTAWDIARECAFDAKVTSHLGWAHDRIKDLKDELEAESSDEDQW